MSGSNAAPASDSFLGLDWSNPWIITGFVAAGVVTVLLISLLIWCIARHTCCKKRTMFDGETTVDRPAPALLANDYLKALMQKNPKATSVSQYGKQQQG